MLCVWELISSCVATSPLSSATSVLQAITLGPMATTTLQVKANVYVVLAFNVLFDTLDLNIWFGSLGSGGHGFCLVNHAAVAAVHALNQHLEIVRRVGIVDFDVHHGNGTEAIVRQFNASKVQQSEHVKTGSRRGERESEGKGETNAREEDADGPRLFYGSVHMLEMFPGQSHLDFFPGTGGASSRCSA